MKERVISLLRWSEQYTKTDMVYFVSNGFWLVMGQIGAVVFSLTLAIVFGHFAAPDTYGNYKYIVTLGSLLTIFSLSGLAPAVSRATARGHHGSLAQGLSLTLRYMLPLVAAGSLGSLYYFHTGNVFAGLGILIATILLPFISGLSLYDPFLVGLKDFPREAIYSVASLGFTTLSLAFTLLFFSQRAIVLVGVYFLTNLLSDALWFVLALRQRVNNEQDPELLRYSFHLSVMSVISAIADKIDSIVIFTVLGPVQLAIYTYAIAMPEQIKNTLKAVAPLSIAKFAVRPIDEIRTTIWNRVGVFALAIASIVVLYILAAPLLFHVLFPIYAGSVFYSQIYALSMITSFITPLTSVLQAHKKTKELYIFSNVPPLILLILLPVLTISYGISGAIASQVVYRVVTALIAVILFRRLRA